MARPNKKPLVSMLVIAVIVALGLCELALRLFVPVPGAKLLPGQLSYQTLDGQVVTPESPVAKDYIVEVEQKKRPRYRTMFAPGKSFYLCYSDAEQLKPDHGWFDAKGRVLVSINEHGVREREELGPDKPAGQKRIVCIGDSFTFGWGIPEELGWVRRLEDELRKSAPEIRTVNCGAAGAICVDEYSWGLRNRFHVFQPDAVVVTICLNDLIPSSGLFVQGPAPDTGCRVLDLVRGVTGRNPMDLDPAVDWVAMLKALPKDEGEAAEMYGTDKPYDAMWARGVPQHSMKQMKAWCDGRKVPLMIVLWPFLQGLGPGRWYPFTSLHQEVEAECKKQDIPFLDLLPALRGTPAEELWVTPADMHANPKAQELVMPDLLAFVRKHCGF